MGRGERRQQVYKALRRALAEDKARTNVLEISELGLVEMTRKRVRQDLRSLFATQCPTCKGSGTVKSDAALAAEIARKVHGVAAEGGGRDLVVRAHADLVRYFEAEGREARARGGRGGGGRGRGGGAPAAASRRSRASPRSFPTPNRSRGTA